MSRVQAVRRVLGWKHAPDMDEGHPESAAEEQEAPMALHPDTIITFAGLHRAELDATSARDRQVAGVSGPALPWRPLAIRVVAFVALVLGLRG